ncbi:hypothetical protein CRG98_029769 [Punica granatum]|uniref:Uncharacterized protein n=1 Tax=Punica granatum TaxID=22663 RepID=A0A2I0J0S4_PUNGR|nr:hypothetical protein CRG98_029769 [Punica granatum]
MASGDSFSRASVARPREAWRLHWGHLEGSGSFPLALFACLFIAFRISRICTVRTRLWTLVGARMRAFGSLGLGVSTFPWGRLTDTRERRSRHLSFYDPKVEGG